MRGFDTLSPLNKERGIYKIAASTGAIAAGAATRLIFYARWSHATRRAFIRELALTGLIATTAFAAGGILVEAKVARGFTAENGTPGGTALTLTGNNAKQRTAFGTTDMAVIRASATAALATPTWTLDDQAYAAIQTHSSGGVGAATPIIGSIYLPKRELIKLDDPPVILAQNEGVAIQVTVPATGVWTAGIEMTWSEHGE